MASRRVLLGTRVTVVLVTLVAILSFATGVINIGVTQVSGPLATLVPEDVERAAGFTGALTGFLMLWSMFGLRRGLRVAWYSTVVLLPVTAVQGLVQSSVVSTPLIVLSLVSLPFVLVNYRRFDRQISLSTTQLAATAALVGTMVYGTAGTYRLRADFANVETILDAVYYTIVTASTVGYGDAIPQTQQARLFSISVLILGVASFTLALGSLLGPAIEARFAQALGTMTERQLELLEDHVIVLGYGDLTEPIIDELDGLAPFVVITPDQDAASKLNARDIAVLSADPSDEEPLHRASIEDARAVVAATNNDANDALAILTAKSLNADIRVVAGATDRENIEKLRRAGADTVISPAVIGGHLLVESALGDENVESLADQLLDTSGGGTGD
ncbi:voltage-gated potassium channel [Halorientalis persicus]|uniref:Voltage-gated potassium channel n=1 Tax=Halorientalis persicus TaxID=1367881 RepID=A0A1H8DR47_9EURY|nr:NAD-binding protein [Halorientalis persicus]SEN09314.1 voltage-gated potassium channel [Halorientalis persicus]